MKTNLIKPTTLKDIHRDQLAAFLAAFEPQLKARNLVLPGPELSETDYYASVCRLLACSPKLPDGLSESLTAILECSTVAAFEDLQEAILKAKVPVDSSYNNADCAIQLWLTNPELLAALHTQRRLLRLSAFDYIGTRTPIEQCVPFVAPDAAKIQALTAALDSWFAAHNRGEETARIQTYPIDGEFWFLVRHGHTFVRASKVEGQRSEILQFRPEKDDVVVYSPAYNRLRINARTKGERELYRTQFGLYLRGSEEYFSEPLVYTLEPLRTLGLNAVDPKGIRSISDIWLRELEIEHAGPGHQVTIRRADNVLNWRSVNGEKPGLPADSYLARAVFDVYFVNSPKKPCTVEITAPDILKIGGNGEPHAIHRWLSDTGYITTQEAVKKEISAFIIRQMSGAPASANPGQVFAC